MSLDERLHGLSESEFEELLALYEKERAPLKKHVTMLWVALAVVVFALVLSQSSKSSADDRLNALLEWHARVLDDYLTAEERQEVERLYRAEQEIQHEIDESKNPEHPEY